MLFNNRQSKYKIASIKPLVEKAVLSALEQEQNYHQWLEDGLSVQLSVIFAGPRVIKQINKDFRDQDVTTDVLSFPMLEMLDGELMRKLSVEDFELLGKKRILYLGDIIINLHKAEKQALEYGHSREREISFLIVHALLHLLGYDHLDKTREAVMVKRQKEVMEALKLER